MGYIQINKAILHILDTNINTPVISEKEMDLDAEQREFLEKHLEKLLEDPSFKPCELDETHMVVKSFIDDFLGDGWIKASQEMAQKFFDTMYANPDIEPGDFLVCHFNTEGKDYIGMLKFNYKTSYIHSFYQDGGRPATGIIKQKTALANEKQKIEECVLINLMSNYMAIKEKRCQVNGEMVHYISEVVFGASPEHSLKEKYQILDQTTKKIVKEYFNDDIQKKSEIKNAIKETIEETGSIQIDQVADKVFKDNESMKENYKNEIKSKGFEENEIEVNEAIERRVYKKQKIKTEEGIEISIPSELLTDKDKIEFKVGHDGTMEIIIKSIQSYSGN